MLTRNALRRTITLSPTRAARDWSHGISRRIAAIVAVFLCVKHSVRHFTMSDWVGSRKAGRFLEAGRPTCSVRRPDWSQTAGNSIFQGVTRMKNPTLKPPCRSALFNLVKGRQIVCQDLTFDQITTLLKEIPACRVKFSKIGGQHG